MELCMMLAQHMPRHKVLHEDTVSKMIRHTAVSPMERQKMIKDELQRNNNMYKTDPYCKEFGINIAGTMAQLTGRLLPPPGIQYRQGKEVAIAQQNPGKWVQRSQDMMYVSGSTLQYWAVLDFGCRASLSVNEYQSMVRGLVSVAGGVS